jgi:purine nucleosidase
MRKLIIDTDTGSDDAVAIVMALREPSVKVVAFTTVSGNVEVEQATYNCLQSIDYAGTYKPPVYKGAARPLQGEYENAEQVHGKDGMGDVGFRAPETEAEDEFAVDAMLRIIREGDGDIEILTIGPLTNLALAMMQEPETMRKVPHLYIMGGALPYSNPHAVWAEYNMMTDPEAAAIVCDFGIPFTMVTLEACWGDMRFDEADIKRFREINETGRFCMDCNRTAIELARKLHGAGSFDLPDPAAFAALVRPDLIKERFRSFTRVDRHGTYTRGATLFQAEERTFMQDAFGFPHRAPNSTIVTAMDGKGFKDYLFDLLSR